VGTTILVTLAACVFQLSVGLLLLAFLFQHGLREPKGPWSQLALLTVTTLVHISITTFVTVLALLQGVGLVGGVGTTSSFRVLDFAQFVLVSPGATIYRYGFPWLSGLDCSPLQFQGLLVLSNSLFCSTMLLASWSVLRRLNARRRE